MSFDAESILGIHAGTKFQTRRSIRGLNPYVTRLEFIDVDVAYPKATQKQRDKIRGRHYGAMGPISVGGTKECQLHTIDSRWRAGDRLWVKEQWRTRPTFNGISPSAIPPLSRKTSGRRSDICYVANGYVPPGLNGKIRAAMFMPRWASRLLLEIVALWPEQVQDITEEDVAREGVRPGSDYKAAFRKRWIGLHGQDSWDANELVWRIQFTPISPDLHTRKQSQHL